VPASGAPPTATGSRSPRAQLTISPATAGLGF